MKKNSFTLVTKTTTMGFWLEFYDSCNEWFIDYANVLPCTLILHEVIFSYDYYNYEKEKMSEWKLLRLCEIIKFHRLHMFFTHYGVNIGNQECSWMESSLFYMLKLHTWCLMFTTCVCWVITDLRKIENTKKCTFKWNIKKITPKNKVFQCFSKLMDRATKCLRQYCGGYWCMYTYF